MEINAKTEVYCVIGNPIEHSLSPALHNAAFQSLGLNAAYAAFCVGNVENAVRGFRGLDIKGVSVTIPHKVSVMSFLDEIDPVAENIGAVNTILNRGGKLKGYNSDGFGALKALSDAGVDVNGRQVVIIGSGGAARAIAFTLAMEKEPKGISILGIEKEQMETLVSELSSKTAREITGTMMDVPGWEAKVKDGDILIHCTPVGMHPNVSASVVPKELLDPNLVVLDIVYTPRVTQLLRFAEEAGCRTIQGLEMFLNQAVIQFELWTGKSAPVDVMRKVLEKNLTE